MKKLTWRIATTGIACLAVGGTLLATGGSATAATPQTVGHTSALTTTTAHTSHHSAEHCAGHRPVDPWIADQLALFGPTAAKRPTAPDPWIADQLALFAPTGP
ncbi:hypothetical protein [Streptomyces sp. NPDC093261]|uniref:hypothetical protein n=1 Tax=Streptomyces sp. NPDC093261 TaxID=3366037 RepID=UPI0037FE52D5